MALIGTIRTKGGTILIVFIAISLLAFVAGDWISSSNSGGNQSQSVGTIGGVEIPYQDFSAKVKEQEDNFISSRGTAPTENDKSQIQEQVWNKYIYDVAFDAEVNELGINVHDEELEDLIQGNHVHAQLQQQFKNEAGAFDKGRLIGWLKTLGTEYDAQRMPFSETDFVNMKNQWIKFEQTLPQTRCIEKYNSLLTKSTFVTTLEAKSKYNADNESVTAKFLYVPYVSILDSTIEVTDTDLQAYLSKNPKQYQKKESTRSIEYVVFPIKASKEDSLLSMDELVDLKEDFIASTNDSLFAKAKADNFVEPIFSSLSNLPQVIQEVYPAVDSGMVFGPMLEGNAYKMYKVTAITEDTVASARASHILFKAASQSDEDLSVALTDCKKVLNEIRNGADFAEMASIHGTDGTKDRGGDLGWFTEGAMVTEFNDAVMAKNGEGLISKPVKTNFGYHIIKVTGAKTYANYKVTSIDREIIAGEETRDLAYRKADVFAGDNTDEVAFNAAIEEDATLIKLVSENIKPQERFLRGAGNARRTIQWAFEDETTVGDVSEVYDLEDGYVVALLTKVSDKGSPSIDDVREAITVKARNIKKAELIKSKLTAGSLADMQAAYGSDAAVLDANNLTLNSTSIPGVGFDPEMTGYFHSVAQGETSEPIAGENGVVVINVTAKTPAPAKEDLTGEKSSLLNQNVGRASSYSFEAIKSAAEIEDNRVKFF